MLLQKAAQQQPTQKENVTIAVEAAQFTFLWQRRALAHGDGAVEATKPQRQDRVVRCNTKAGAPSGADELFARAAEAEFFADIDELNAPVDS